MNIGPLKYLSEAKLAELRQDITANRSRYLTMGFVDLERENGWASELASVQVDYEALEKLDGDLRTAEADIANSLIVHRALKGMTSALAREERVWVRLTHVECLEYSRLRWLARKTDGDLDSAVSIHMFAPNLTGIRDDNAIARLWWNVHIAEIADPDDPEGALKLILKSADIRSNFVERTFTASRRPLAQAVIRAMRKDPWITASEQAFRKFMIQLNRDGGGVLFEALSEADTDALLARCAALAKAVCTGTSNAFQPRQSLNVVN